MLGVKIPPETVAQIEAIVPQLPAKIQEIIGVVNSTLQNFDKRLKAIETALAAQNELLVKLLEVYNGRTDSGGDSAIPAGTGATQRIIERCGT